MSSLPTIHRLLEGHDRGEYFSRLIHRPAAHSLRERPVLAYHTALSPVEPRSTMVIPTFNHAPIVHDVLQALVAHAAQPFDCIVVDDGSDDGTAEAAVAFFESGAAASVARATVLRNPVPVFETACDNLGFALAETELIIELQADIEIREPAFDRLLQRALATQPTPSAASGRCGHSFAALRRRRHWPWPVSRPQYPAVGLCGEAIESPQLVEPLRGRAYRCETVNRGPWALRRSDLERHGYLDERHFFLGNDDHDYHRRLWQAEARRPLYVPMALYAPLERGAARRPRTGLNRTVFCELKASRTGSPDYHRFLDSLQDACAPQPIALD